MSVDILMAKCHLDRNEIDKPSQYDPGTMVYKLVQQLKRYLEEE